jgi:alkylation response protein AidB-like acyl-CoA dehydrogenase
MDALDSTGKLLGCFGLTEPSAGSDPSTMSTTATADVAGGYRLNGVKTWITNAPIADMGVVWAKDASDGGRIRGFVVERGMKGMETPHIEGQCCWTCLECPVGTSSSVQHHLYSTQESYISGVL